MKPGMSKAVDANAIVARAIQCHQAGNLDEAQSLYEKALALRPLQPDALHLSAVLLHQRGNARAALQRFAAALEVSPKVAAIHFNRGKALRDSHKLDDAIASLERATKLEPRFDQAHYELATALDESGQYEKALDSFTRAASLRPSAPAWQGVGNCLARLQRGEEAVQAFLSALQLEPGNGDAAYNLALVQASIGRAPQALEIAHRIAVAPSANHHGRATALFQAGQIQLCLGQLAQARQFFQQTLSLETKHPQALVGLAQLDLLEGQWESGWAGYETRWLLQDKQVSDAIWARPRWSGRESLEGKTILVHAEQGLGDTLQFCRYLPLLEARGAKVVAQVQAPLTTLLRRSLSSTIRVLDEGGDPGEWDWHCPLLSLPLAFATRLDSIPANDSYLVAGARPQWLQACRDEAANRDCLFVGLAWSGNIRHANDINRSIPPNALRMLLEANRDMPNRKIRFVALQTQFRTADQEILAQNPSLAQFVGKIDSFDDTAALIGACDLVISADTSVAHLAGALGHAVWVLLPHVPDWRWMLGREDSPWYPRARLVRQQRPGDWAGVMRQVVQDLRERYT